MNYQQDFISKLIDKYGGVDSAIDELRAGRRERPVECGLDLQVLLNAVGREEDSFALSEELVKIAPEDPRVLFNHGWHWLKRGQMQKALTLLEYGRPLRSYGHLPLPSSQPLWAPESGRGHRVHIVLEGGIGDEVIHLRFGRDLVERHGCKVTVLCRPALAPLVARLPWVSAVAQREAALGIFHDSWVPGMSLPLALGFEYPDISGKPYLQADPTQVKQWGALLGRSPGRPLRVGIRWAGNPEFAHQQLRVFPPEILLSLRSLPNVQLYSFQRDADLIDLPEDIVDLGPRLQTWDDTAAALMNMDLVISSCTSVAHVSAALGRPTWVVVPALPYFIWAHPGDKSPWYDSVTLFRQGAYGSWDDVGSKLRTQLAKTVEGRA